MAVLKYTSNRRLSEGRINLSAMTTRVSIRAEGATINRLWTETNNSEDGPHRESAMSNRGIIPVWRDIVIPRKTDEGRRILNEKQHMSRTGNCYCEFVYVYGRGYLMTICANIEVSWSGRAWLIKWGRYGGAGAGRDLLWGIAVTAGNSKGTDLVGLGSVSW